MRHLDALARIHIVPRGALELVPWGRRGGGRRGAAALGRRLQGGGPLLAAAGPRGASRPLPSAAASPLAPPTRVQHEHVAAGGRLAFQPAHGGSAAPRAPSLTPAACNPTLAPACRTRTSLPAAAASARAWLTAVAIRANPPKQTASSPPQGPADAAAGSNLEVGAAVRRGAAFSTWRRIGFCGARRRRRAGDDARGWRGRAGAARGAPRVDVVEMDDPQSGVTARGRWVLWARLHATASCLQTIGNCLHSVWAVPYTAARAQRARAAPAPGPSTSAERNAAAYAKATAAAWSARSARSAAAGAIRARAAGGAACEGGTGRRMGGSGPAGLRARKRTPGRTREQAICYAAPVALALAVARTSRLAMASLRTTPGCRRLGPPPLAQSDDTRFCSITHLQASGPAYFGSGGRVLRARAVAASQVPKLMREILQSKVEACMWSEGRRTSGCVIRRPRSGARPRSLRPVHGPLAHRAR